MTGTAIHGGVALNLDVDLTPYIDSVVIIEARVLGTTKSGTAHMTDAAVTAAFAIFDNKNGAASLGTPSAGGYANPFQSGGTPGMLATYPQTTDPNLRSGGFAPWNAVWVAPGGAIARLIVTNAAPVQDGDVLVFFTLYVKPA